MMHWPPSMMRFGWMIVCLMLCAAGCDDSNAKDSTPSVPDTPNPDDPNPDKPNPDDPNPDDPNPDKPNPDKPNPDDPNPDDPNPDDPSAVDTVTDESCGATAVESCLDNVAKYCNDDGKYVLRDCTKLGSSKSCQKYKELGIVDCVEKCDRANLSYEEGKFVCDGTSPTSYYCAEVESGGTYTFSFSDGPCPKYCSDGACVTEKPVTEGDACTADFVQQCVGNDGFSCVDGVVTKTVCSGNTHCAMQVGAKSFECTESCLSTTPDDTSCVEIDGKPATQNKVCRVGTDHKFHLFTEREMCSKFCTEGVCDIETIPNEGDACKTDSFEEFCVQNSAYYCDYTSDTVTIMQCGKADFIGQPFCRKIEGSMADCVVPCDEGAETLSSCSSYKNDAGEKIAYVERTECKKATDGAFYYFTSQSDCPNGCKSGACL